MEEQLTKLRPDRDLQCYFLEPSAVAALSGSSASGFTVSGSWRQQFDWAVLEWSRDNVFEHPALRNLPDGDLHGLHLSYEEVRTNCVPFDSTTYDSIGWSYLRIWEQSNNQENIHWIPLRNYATPVAGDSVPATVYFDLQGVPHVDDIIELVWLDQHANYKIVCGDTLESALAGLAGFINTMHDQGGGVVTAGVNGTRITLTYTGAPGSNGNRVGVCASVSGAGTQGWSQPWAMFAGGQSPQRWRVDLDFGNLTDNNGQTVTTTNVRKVRWTWAADLQAAAFQRSEFSVVVTNWQVTGTNLTYNVAGPYSRRIEDDSREISYSGSWLEDRGNYSGGSIRYTQAPGNGLRCTYTHPLVHTLYLGTRYVNAELEEIVQATVVVDGNSLGLFDLKRPQEDVLIRISLGQLAANAPHTVTVTHSGTSGTKLYFDFLELAVPTADLPSFADCPTTTLATDWDTNHSLAIAPERTAWLIDTLGFKGRANHYAGALWFYELGCPDNRYATATITFSGTPQFSQYTRISLGETTLEHLNLISDTAETIAKCFEFLINAGSSALWAHADGTTLTLTARAMGEAGNGLAVFAPSGGGMTVTTSGALAGGVTGKWLTDLTAMPRINRAARDWSSSFFRALKAYGIDVAAAFSTELGNGDDSLTAGIAQRYPNGDPVWVNTPALQTNFSPASLAYWQQVYLDMAAMMAGAGVAPYLQFGEVQWWYFAGPSGMTFYDAYTTSSFQTAYGRPMGVIASQDTAPAAFPDECAFLPGVIGSFTAAIMSFVRQSQPNTRFEVLYPPDTNDTPLNRLVNYPASQWTPANLDCLKTENFTYTGNRDLDQARESIALPGVLGFPPAKRSHLVGIGDYTTPWSKERLLALGANVESVVLFALDQFCLIGYAVPLVEKLPRRALFLGSGA